MSTPLHAEHDLDLAPEPPEAPARRQPGSRVLVQLDGHPDVELVITNRERLAYEKTAARHPEWPAPERSRSFVMTFVTFAAAKRAGHPAATTFDAWQELLLDWDEADQPADPTR
jgi:hypothetical protein